MAQFIGRETELDTIRKLFASSKSEFLAVYGRRRVGKTFLIREATGGMFSFYVTAMAHVTIRSQLAAFTAALKKYHSVPNNIKAPKTWLDAFLQLEELLEQDQAKRKVVFIDELPWFDTPRSSFISALEHFWNSWASARKDVFLIVCGSAASWMINKLIRNTGGLYNRVTARIKLEPFLLREAALFLHYKGAKYDKYQVVELYMAMGGIPFYLDQVNVRLSPAQNINALFFDANGLLHTEFDQLYRSLFTNSEKYIQAIEAISSKAKGITREEIIRNSRLPNSGVTSQILRDLEESGFIRRYRSFGKKEKRSLYQLVDFYSLFYLRFIRREPSSDSHQWINGLDHPRQRTWAGYAFEQICLAHVEQIKSALGISGIQTAVSSWTGEGAQIDLVIERRDRIINLCEMKFSMSEFTVTKAYAEQLRNKVNAFREATGISIPLFLTMITTFGVKRNEYAVSLLQNELRMDVLFE